MFALAACSDGTSEESALTMSFVLDKSQPSDWREPAPENTLYMMLEQGTVVFELAPEFAPNTVDNIRTLVVNKYFDGLSINRSQENYVVQWGDAAAGTDAQKAHGIPALLQPEFYRSPQGLEIIGLDSHDAYAEAVGFVAGFPVGSDASRAWLAHCYSMLGVGRDVAPDSGNGTELYVVTGHAPRHLDRNVTLVGRVIYGIEHLTTLPRGSGPLGFYETEQERVPIQAIRLGSDVPESQRLPIEIFRTDTEAFQKLLEARRNRLEGWFVDPAGRIGLCNVPVPQRIVEDSAN